MKWIQKKERPCIIMIVLNLSYAKFVLYKVSCRTYAAFRDSGFFVCFFHPLRVDMCLFHYLHRTISKNDDIHENILIPLSIKNISSWNTSKMVHVYPKNEQYVNEKEYEVKLYFTWRFILSCPKIYLIWE